MLGEYSFKYVFLFIQSPAIGLCNFELVFREMFCFIYLAYPGTALRRHIARLTPSFVTKTINYTRLSGY